MSRTVGGEEEDSMDQMIVCAVVLVALGSWVRVVSGRRAVAVQRKAGTSRPRIK